MTKLALFLMCILSILSGCAHGSHEITVAVAGKKISLDSEKCLLNVDNKTLNIEMKPRCYFIRGDTGKEAGINHKKHNVSINQSFLQYFNLCRYRCG